MTFVYFILLLGAIILIHEWGHLVAAKKFGVYCYEFSFGMGPLLWHTKKGETQYSVRAIPVGGFVSMAGEQDGDAAYPDVEVPVDRRLIHKKPWQRIIIMLAGIFMNFVLAFLIFSLIYLRVGAYYPEPDAIVDSVMDGSPAEAAGFQAGDRIIRITDANGKVTEIEKFSDISITDGSTLTYTVVRNGEEVNLAVTPSYSEEYQRYMIGINAKASDPVPVNFLNCWKYGAMEMGTLSSLMFSALRSLFKLNGLKQLSGPVGIYSVTEQAAKAGALTYFYLMGELSLNVGIFNLLPLPVLDGGQVLFTVIEWIRGKAMSEKAKIAVMTACWGLLIALMLFVTWNDVSRLLGS